MLDELRRAEEVELRHDDPGRRYQRRPSAGVYKQTGDLKRLSITWLKRPRSELAARRGLASQQVLIELYVLTHLTLPGEVTTHTVSHQATPLTSVLE